MTKHALHIQNINALAVGQSYLIECKKSQIHGMMGIHQRKAFGAKRFTNTSYVAVPMSLVQDIIYVLRITRRL